MPLYVEVVVIGPFKPELLQHYEYPAEYYDRCALTAPMVRTLFGIVEGSGAGRDFASALGIDDVWDFNKHKIDQASIDFSTLQAVLEGLAGWTEDDGYRRDLESFKAFVAAGYDLYFIPNG